MNLSNVITDKLSKVGFAKVAIFALAAIVVGGCAIAYAVTSDDQPTTEQQEAIAEMENLKDESINLVIDDIEIPWADMGYASLEEYREDMAALHESAKGMAENAIAKYSSVITDAQKTQLEQYESTMANCMSPDEYEKAIGKFNEIVAELELKLNPPKPEPEPEQPSESAKPDTGNNSNDESSKPTTKPESNSTVDKYTGGSFKIPYNFKQMGVLHDSEWRYTWYSSRTLYHYKTPQWILGSDGIYRDSRGYVIVASDAHKQGTVFETELFGWVVVEDCGVGRKDTLDVYVGF